MKALLLHCKNYHIKVGLLANRPADIKPESVTYPEQSAQDCVVALITVEAGDTVEKADKLVADIEKMAQDVAHHSVVILPFAHLSNDLADSETAIEVLEAAKIKLPNDYEVMRGHFGSHKEFLLDVFGHPGNVRFRDY